MFCLDLEAQAWFLILITLNLQGLSMRQIRFRFDGQPINETDTPAQVWKTLLLKIAIRIFWCLYADQRGLKSTWFWNSCCKFSTFQMVCLGRDFFSPSWMFSLLGEGNLEERQCWRSWHGSAGVEKTPGKCWRLQLCPPSASACSEPALELPQLLLAPAVLRAWEVCWAGRARTGGDTRPGDWLWKALSCRVCSDWQACLWKPFWCWRCSDRRDDGVSALEWLREGVSCIS